MTDKPMDVERKLLVGQEVWVRGVLTANQPENFPATQRVYIYGIGTGIPRNDAVREALREPGELSVEQVHPEIQKLAKKIGDEFCGGSETVMDIIEAELCSFVYLSCTPAGRASKQEPPAPARCPHCKGTKESPMPLSDAGARCFNAFHDSPVPPVEGKQEPGAEAAPPLCVICGKREEMHGASNQCNLDEEFSPRWTPPRAAAGESTERQLDLDGLIGQVLMGYGAGLTRDRIKQICEKWLAASQERSA
jgi:hypothetical protein